MFDCFPVVETIVVVGMTVVAGIVADITVVVGVVDEITHVAEVVVVAVVAAVEIVVVTAVVCGNLVAQLMVTADLLYRGMCGWWCTVVVVELDVVCRDIRCKDDLYCRNDDNA